MTFKILSFILITSLILGFIFFMFTQVIPRKNVDGPYALFRGQKFKKGNVKYLAIGLLIGLVISMIYLNII